MNFESPGRWLTRLRHFRRRIAFESWLKLLLAVLILPSVLLLTFLAMRSQGAQSLWILLGIVIICDAVLVVILIDHIVRPLQTLSNVISALREGDYSFRARGSRNLDCMGELAKEVNSLADLLQKDRLQALESSALLNRVMETMNTPVFAFDQDEALHLANPAAVKWLNKSPQEVLGRTAKDLGLDSLFSRSADEALNFEHGEYQSRWMVRRTTFRQGGVPHTLFVLSDVSSVLREEERLAWQRLIRVLGHELNNSLTPIKSIAGVLIARLGEGNRMAEMKRGLEVIEGRAEALNRFIQAYRLLAQLPPPNLQRVNLPELIERVAALENRIAVKTMCRPDIEIMADPDQLEQLFINLVRNAADAALNATDRPHPIAPNVTILHSFSQTIVTISITDNGDGLSNSTNLFVPLYTTKVGGSGIGLALALQIAEAHGGSVRLGNRKDAKGCVASVTLPIYGVASAAP